MNLSGVEDKQVAGRDVNAAKKKGRARQPGHQDAFRQRLTAFLRKWR